MRWSPGADDEAVLAQQRHHVRHGGKRRQIDVFHGRRPPGERLHQFEGHARAGEMRAGIAVQKRIDQRAVRQVRAGAVVVGDDDVHAQFFGQRRHVHGVDAAIHGDEQVGVLRQRAHGLLVEAVALAVAVGQVGANVRAQRCQVQVEDGRGGDAVHVVIAVDADAFARLQRRAHALHGPAHVREQQRVVEQFLAGGEEGARLGGGGDAALHEDRVQQPGHVRGALKKSALRLPPAIDEHICRPLPFVFPAKIA